MEQFNKVISFILGLVVVVIFLAIATGRINLKGTPFSFSKGSSSTKITPTPTPKSKSTSFTLNQTSIPQDNTPSSSSYNPQYHSYNGGAVSTIPNTGPEFLLPLIASSFLGGLFLKGKGKK